MRAKLEAERKKSQASQAEEKKVNAQVLNCIAYSVLWF